VAVLEPAVAFVAGVEHKQVVPKGRRLVHAVPELDTGLADGLGVAQQACAIKTRPGAADHEPVRDAAHAERSAPEPAQLDGAIGQLVVVGGLPVA